VKCHIIVWLLAVRTNRDTAYIVSIDFQRTEEDGEDGKLPYEEVMDGNNRL